MITYESIKSIVLNAPRIDTQLGKTTVVHITLPNGFEVVASAAPIDKSKYNHAIGIEVCLDKLVDIVWQLEAYKSQG